VIILGVQGRTLAGDPLDLHAVDEIGVALGQRRQRRERH
jgi:hypothetical protein